MSQLDRQSERLISAQLQRVLIVDPSTPGARLLADLLKLRGARLVQIEATTGAAMTACRAIEPQMVFTELSGPGLNGLDLVRELRRSSLGCRKSPVIVVTSEATAATITASRDAGVHEFLRKPFTVNDLSKRLEAVTLKSRPWVEAVQYIGPDRRRFNSADFDGERKRKSDGEGPPAPADRVSQALKILRSAIDAIESDPLQALRSMQAQVAELNAVALETMNVDLARAVFMLQQNLKQAAMNGRLSRTDFEACAVPLWAFKPPESETDRGGQAA